MCLFACLLFDHVSLSYVGFTSLNEETFRGWIEGKRGGILGDRFATSLGTQCCIPEILEFPEYTILESW